jgi:hypothetical protein
MKALKILAIAAALVALAAPPSVSAQSTAPTPVMFEWGALHPRLGQAISLNFALSDEGGPLTLEIEITDQSGKVLYQNTVMVSSGQAISFVVGPEVRGLPDIRNIPADIYLAVGPDIRTIQPCLKVLLPPGPSGPLLDRVTPTLEVLDVTTGRLMNFSNNPHMIIGVL